MSKIIRRFKFNKDVCLDMCGIIFNEIVLYDDVFMFIGENTVKIFNLDNCRFLCLSFQSSDKTSTGITIHETKNKTLNNVDSFIFFFVSEDISKARHLTLDVFFELKIIMEKFQKNNRI